MKDSSRWVAPVTFASCPDIQNVYLPVLIIAGVLHSSGFYLSVDGLMYFEIFYFIMVDLLTYSLPS